MNVYLAADHRGFEFKEKLKSWLLTNNFNVIDCGNDHLDPEDDYVDFTVIATQKLLADQDPENSTGVVICGSGIGVTIAANRFKGIRCALCISPEHAKHARTNDHANMLALPAEFLTEEQAEQIFQAFVSTQPSSEEKYIRRKEKLDALNS